MAWGLALGLGAANALLAGQQARRQRSQERQAQQANATAMEWSPWTGVQTQFMPSQTRGVGEAMLGGALSGGLTGYQLGRDIDAANALQSKKAQSIADQATAGDIGLPAQRAAQAATAGDVGLVSGGPSPWTGMRKSPSLYGGMRRPQLLAGLGY